MLYYLYFITTTLIILCFLLGLYYFSKQNLDNIFVRLTVSKKILILLKSNKLNQKYNNKVKFILTSSTILLIILFLLMMYFIKSNHDNIKYIICILLYLVAFFPNRYILK